MEFYDDCGEEVEYICERQDQSLLSSGLTHYSDYAVWQMLKTQTSILTKVCHTSRSEMARLLGMRKATFFGSIARMCDACLVLPFGASDGIAAGLVLNPSLITVGDHADAWARWRTACEQARERGEMYALAAQLFYDKWRTARAGK